MNIQRLIATGESEVLEFKTSFGKDVIETVCAFANHKGGTVLVGVAEGGKVVGVTCGEESIQNWVNEVKQNTMPSIIPDIAMALVKGKVVVIIRVDEFPVKPVACRDRYYKRVANSNHRLTLTEIANIHIQSLQLSWDAYTENQATPKDLSPRKMKSFLRRVKEGGRFKGEGDWQVILEKLGYLKDGVPTHAAMILFGKDDPPYQLHIGRFKTPSTIIDDRMIRGTLFDVVEEAMKFIISHLKVAFEITGDLQRHEIFDYPVPALRELLLNAVVHRDYTSPTDIQIKIFDNSITFFNPGRLYGDLTIEKLKTDCYQSRTRNKLIAEAFYLTRDIEKYGSGYIRVRREISDYPTMQLDYEESGDGFLASVRYQEQKTITTPKTTTKKSTGAINVPLNVPLNERVLNLIREQPGIRRTELALKLAVTEKTISRHVSMLLKSGSVERRGSKKTGGYFLK